MTGTDDRPRHLFASFTKVRKVDGGGLRLFGRLTQEVVDSEGDRVTFEAVREAVQFWIGNVREMHAPRPVGRVLKIIAVPEEKAFDVEVFISSGVPDVIKLVLDEVYRGFSLGFDVISGGVRKLVEAGRVIREITKIRIKEMSLVDKPAVPTAWFEIVKVEGGRPRLMLLKEGTMSKKHETAPAADPKAEGITKDESPPEVTKAVTPPSPPPVVTKGEDDPEEKKVDGTDDPKPEESEVMKRLAALEAKQAEREKADAEKADAEKAEGDDPEKPGDEEEPEEMKFDEATAGRMMEAIDSMQSMLAGMREVVASMAAGDGGAEMKAESLPSFMKSAKVLSENAEAVGKIADVLESIDSRLQKIESQPVITKSRGHVAERPLGPDFGEPVGNELEILQSVADSINPGEQVSGKEMLMRLAHGMVKSSRQAAG